MCKGWKKITKKENQGREKEARKLEGGGNGQEKIRQRETVKEKKSVDRKNRIREKTRREMKSKKRERGQETRYR